MEHRTPHPRVHLYPPQNLEPTPELVLRADPAPDLGDPADVDVEVAEGHERGERLLDRAESVEGPFAVDWGGAERWPREEGKG